MVSIVIGRGGNQIKHLQTKTQTDIYIDANKTDRGQARCAQITGILIIKTHCEYRTFG